MKLEVLGSGGSIVTPKMLCSCAVCSEAREKGVPYSRLGPSVFIHGPNILIDTPEEISVQLGRSGISEIAACMYSHWHPDHTAGRRVFEAGIDYINVPPDNSCVPVVLTETVAATFESRMGLMDHINFMEQKGIVRKRIIGDAESIEINGYVVEPVQLAQEYVFGFIVSGNDKRVLVIMDELKDWEPSSAILDASFDIVYLPFGILKANPITGEKLLPDDHYLLEVEHTVEEALDLIARIDSKVFVFSHIEEAECITLDFARELEQYYSDRTAKTITFAFDTMQVEA